ncbi:MAG: hypothetical protein ISS79_03115 [Phycisphaerae bacterium]|nr:hypothetical protein [Phycisphaerae bacterium]
MKITGAKAIPLLILAIVWTCLAARIPGGITAEAQFSRASPARTASPAPVVRRTSRTSSLSARRTDPNSKPAQVNPILQRVLEVSGRTEQKGPELLLDKNTSKARISSIRTVDFYLRDGKLIFGKLIAEDRNKVIVERIEGSKIIVATYSKRDMDSRTLQAKNVSANKYYLELAEYFAGRTFDFTDDPDDFIQAIRFYRIAKQLIEGTSQLDIEKSKEIDLKVAQLEADREVWTKQVQSRAKLRELEFQAEFQKRFSELEAKIDASAQKIDESIAKIDEALADVKQNTETLEKNIPAMEQDLRRRLDVLGSEVEANRRLLDPYGRYPRRNYGYRSRY